MKVFNFFGCLFLLLTNFNVYSDNTKIETQVMDLLENNHFIPAMLLLKASNMDLNLKLPNDLKLINYLVSQPKLEALKYYYIEGGDLDPDRDSKFLQYSCFKRNLEFVEYFLSVGVKLQPYSGAVRQSCIYLAVENADVELTDIIYNNLDSNDQKYIFNGAFRKRVQYLKSYYADLLNK